MIKNNFISKTIFLTLKKIGFNHFTLIYNLFCNIKSSTLSKI